MKKSPSLTAEVKRLRAENARLRDEFRQTVAIISEYNLPCPRCWGKLGTHELDCPIFVEGNQQGDLKHT